MRRALRERLESEYGDQWWEHGVIHALSDQQRESIEKFSEGVSSEDRLLLLDAPHFTRIVSGNHQLAFSDAFSNYQRTFNDLRALTRTRNQWAHMQDIPTIRVMQAVDRMKHILASMRCEEALEIDNMSESLDMEFQDDVNEEVPDLDNPDDPSETPDSNTYSSPWALWHHLQSYLVLEESVVLPAEGSNRDASVTVTVHNTAPTTPDWPEIHFKAVYVRTLGGGSNDVGYMKPGQTREMRFRFPAKQLIEVEFDVFGEVDADKLLGIRKTVTLPEEIIEPLRQEFVNRFDSVGIRKFVSDALSVIDAMNPNMTLADVDEARTRLNSLSEDVSIKQSALVELLQEFRLDGNWNLGAHGWEIQRSLEEFRSRISDLSRAISRIDLERMNRAVSDLKQIQLAVLRVEDSIRSMTVRS